MSKNGIELESLRVNGFSIFLGVNNLFSSGLDDGMGFKMIQGH